MCLSATKCWGINMMGCVQAVKGSSSLWTLWVIKQTQMPSPCSDKASVTPTHSATHTVVECLMTTEATEWRTGDGGVLWHLRPLSQQMVRVFEPHSVPDSTQNSYTWKKSTIKTCLEIIGNILNSLDFIFYFLWWKNMKGLLDIYRTKDRLLKYLFISLISRLIIRLCSHRKQIFNVITCILLTVKHKTLQNMNWIPGAWFYVVQQFLNAVKYNFCYK